MLCFVLLQIYVLSDPQLPVGKLVHNIKPWTMPEGLRSPLNSFKSVGYLVLDRYDKGQDCNLYFTLGKKVDNVPGKEPEIRTEDETDGMAENEEDSETHSTDASADMTIPGLATELASFIHIKRKDLMRYLLDSLRVCSRAN